MPLLLTEPPVCSSRSTKWHLHRVDLCEVVREHLLDTAVLLRLLLQRI